MFWCTIHWKMYGNNRILLTKWSFRFIFLNFFFVIAANAQNVYHHASLSSFLSDFVSHRNYSVQFFVFFLPRVTTAELSPLKTFCDSLEITTGWWVILNLQHWYWPCRQRERERDRVRKSERERVRASPSFLLLGLNMMGSFSFWTEVWNLRTLRCDVGQVRTRRKNTKLIDPKHCLQICVMQISAGWLNVEYEANRKYELSAVCTESVIQHKNKLCTRCVGINTHSIRLYFIFHSKCLFPLNVLLNFSISADPFVALFIHLQLTCS